MGSMAASGLFSRLVLNGVRWRLNRVAWVQWKKRALLAACTRWRELAASIVDMGSMAISGLFSRLVLNGVSWLDSLAA